MSPREKPQSKSTPQRQCVRVAAYCRVSMDTPVQRASLEQQIRAYETMITLNPDWEFIGIYADIASGLRLQHRDGYMRLLRDCKRGKIDIIIEMKGMPLLEYMQCADVEMNPEEVNGEVELKMC